MDPKFQTSFIPKKSVVDASLPKRTGVGIFTIISVFLFLSATGAGLYVFLYDQTTKSDIVTLQKKVDDYKKRLEEKANKEIILLDARLKKSNDLINKHVVPSVIFDVISSVTIPDVQWKDFRYELNDKGIINLTMNGVARNLAAVVVQSDVIIKDERFRNPYFSDVSLDDKQVPQFSLTTEITPNTISYSKIIQDRVALIEEQTRLQQANQNNTDSTSNPDSPSTESSDARAIRLNGVDSATGGSATGTTGSSGGVPLNNQ